MRKMIIQSKTQAAWRKKSQKLPTGVKPMTVRLPGPDALKVMLHETIRNDDF